VADELASEFWNVDDILRLGKKLRDSYNIRGLIRSSNVLWFEDSELTKKILAVWNQDCKFSTSNNICLKEKQLFSISFKKKS